MAYKLDTISFCTAFKACIEMPRVKVAVFSSARYYNVVLEDIRSYIQQHYPDVTIFSVNNHRTMSFANGSMISAYPRTETSYRGFRCHFALYEEDGITDEELERIRMTETPYILPPEYWSYEADIDTVSLSFFTATRTNPFDQHTSPHFQRVDYNPENFSVEIDRDTVDAMASIPDSLRFSIVSGGDDNGFRADTYVLDDFSGAAPIEFDSERFEEFIGEYKKRE